jgi:hypothetical protein
MSQLLSLMTKRLMIAILMQTLTIHMKVPHILMSIQLLPLTKGKENG